MKHIYLYKMRNGTWRVVTNSSSGAWFPVYWGSSESNAKHVFNDMKQSYNIDEANCHLNTYPAEYEDR